MARADFSGDLAERLHAFQVVCKVAMQLNQTGAGNGCSGGIKTRNKIGLLDLGKREFTLTHCQARYCIGRARNLLDEIRQAERLRNAREMKRNPAPLRIAA